LTSEYFRVVHPYHPLFGREFQVADYRHNWGEDRVYFHNPNGVLTSIPTGWTSLFGQDPFVVMAAGRSHFRVGDLVELARLIEGLKS
jgi:hypothetical protein